MDPMNPNPMTPTTVVTNITHVTRQDLLSVAWWKNILTSLLAIVVTALAFFHPGYHFPPAQQALVTTVIPTAAIIAVAVSNALFVHGTHQVKIAQLINDTEVQRLGVEERKLQVQLQLQQMVMRNAPPAPPPAPTLVSGGDSGQPVTPTTP